MKKKETYLQKKINAIKHHFEFYGLVLTRKKRWQILRDKLSAYIDEKHFKQKLKKTQRIELFETSMSDQELSENIITTIREKHE